MFWKHKLRKSVVCTCSKRIDMKPLRAAFAELQISQNRDWDAERRDGGLRPDCAVNLNVKSGKVPVACLTGVISADDIGRSGMVQLVRDKCGFDFFSDEDGAP